MDPPGHLFFVFAYCLPIDQEAENPCHLSPRAIRHPPLENLSSSGNTVQENAGQAQSQNLDRAGHHARLHCPAWNARRGIPVKPNEARNMPGRSRSRSRHTALLRKSRPAIRAKESGQLPRNDFQCAQTSHANQTAKRQPRLGKPAASAPASSFQGRRTHPSRPARRCPPRNSAKQRITLKISNLHFEQYNKRQLRNIIAFHCQSCLYPQPAYLRRFNFCRIAR